MITVLLADDLEEYRVLLRKMLEMDGRFTVVGEAPDGVAAVRLARETDPDVVLLDIAMPEMDGLEAIPHLRRVAPRSRVVMLSGFGEEVMSDTSLRLGADAYVVKGHMTDDLVRTLTSVLP
ncbi:MAG: response regulator transcription factor [Actinobacteria bacterium]|nr:MAG: response regulator transcription factor [Actinomycetota bacterium]